MRFPASPNFHLPVGSVWNVCSGSYLRLTFFRNLTSSSPQLPIGSSSSVCKVHVLPRSVRPNALPVLGGVAHGRVHQLTHPRVLGRVIPKGDEHVDDDVVLDLIQTENVTAVVDAVLGSHVGDGLTFCQQESVRRVLVGVFVNDFVDLSQDSCGFGNQTGVDVAEATGKAELAREIVQGCDAERSSTWKRVTILSKGEVDRGRGKDIRVSPMIGGIIVASFGCVADILV